MYRLKSMWRTLGLFCLICPLQAFAQEQWCAVTDHNHIVTLSNISYLASTPGETKFNIVLNNGTAIEDVESMMFAKFHVDGVEEVELGRTTELGFTGESILISNAPMGASVTISTIEGRNILYATIETESQQVDISCLAKDIYILNVGGKTVKFRKL